MDRAAKLRETVESFAKRRKDIKARVKTVAQNVRLNRQARTEKPTR